MPFPVPYDFKDNAGPVPANTHINGGGWVASSAFVESTVWVGPDAKVFGRAKITGKITILGHTRICDDANLSGKFILHDPFRPHSCTARIEDNALVQSRADFMHSKINNVAWTAYKLKNGLIQLRYANHKHTTRFWETADPEKLFEQYREPQRHIESIGKILQLVNKKMAGKQQ